MKQVIMQNCGKAQTEEEFYHWKAGQEAIKDTTGFVLHKCDNTQAWKLYSSEACVRNKKGYLMQSRALGDLLSKAAKEFGL